MRKKNNVRLRISNLIRKVGTAVIVCGLAVLLVVAAKFIGFINFKAMVIICAVLAFVVILLINLLFKLEERRSNLRNSRE